MEYSYNTDIDYYKLYAQTYFKSLAAINMTYNSKYVHSMTSLNTVTVWGINLPKFS